MAKRFASATIPKSKKMISALNREFDAGNMSEQTIAELIAERDEMKRRWDDSLNIQRIQSATLERMIAARDAEQLAKERAEKNVCTMQEALFEILMHTESYNYNSYQRIISKIAKMAVKALKESGAKLEKTI
jgi:ribosomal protein L15